MRRYPWDPGDGTGCCESGANSAIRPGIPGLVPPHRSRVVKPNSCQRASLHCEGVESFRVKQERPSAFPWKLNFTGSGLPFLVQAEPNTTSRQYETIAPPQLAQGGHPGAGCGQNAKERLIP